MIEQAPPRIRRHHRAMATTKQAPPPSRRHHRAGAKFKQKPSSRRRHHRTGANFEQVPPPIRYHHRPGATVKQAPPPTSGVWARYQARYEGMASRRGFPNALESKMRVQVPVHARFERGAWASIRAQFENSPVPTRYAGAWAPSRARFESTRHARGRSRFKREAWDPVRV